MLDAFGLPPLVEAQREVARLIAAGRGPDAFVAVDDKFVRAAVRVALRKLKARGSSSAALAPGIQEVRSRVVTTTATTKPARVLRLDALWALAGRRLQRRA